MSNALRTTPTLPAARQRVASFGFSLNGRPSPRFTRDGSDSLEQNLNNLCADVLRQIRQAIPSRKLEAILLGGGYGRGEGGVLKTAVGDQPYNDLEFYVCLRGNRFLTRRSWQQPLHEIALSLTASAGIDVEFQVISLDCLRRAQPSMFYYDLMSGHRWIFGDERLLAGCEHLRQPANIPVSEATRLLMNRCTGLLLAQEKLNSPTLNEVDADFVGRNLAKIQLALGDAVLTQRGEYHWSCLERHARLSVLLARHPCTWRSVVTEHHAAGVEFKLHPWRTNAPPDELRARLRELKEIAGKVWLWLERQRLDCPFSSAEDYAFSNVNKCPETSAWRNCLLNLIGLGAPPIWTHFARHPRERLLHALPLLLWSPDPNGSRFAPQISRVLQNLLIARAADRASLLEAYLKLWQRFR